MSGRAVIQIPTKDIVCIENNDKKGITEITLEGDQYPNWYTGQDPMVIIGALQLLSEEFINDILYEMTHCRLAGLSMERVV